jgi:hypothetical protein
MKLREHLPEWSAYATAGLLLGVVGSRLLAHGPDRLSALAAGWNPVSLLVWAGALAAAGAAVGVILRRRDMVTHVPLSLCVGLLAARWAAPSARIDRLDLILPPIPGWPWAFALEIGVWLGLLWIGIQAADRAGAWADRLRPEPATPSTDPAPATPTTASPAAPIAGAVPPPGRLTAGVWTVGDVCYRRIPRPGLTAAAQIATAVIALGPAWLLLREYAPLESRKLAGFTLWFGFFLGSAAVLGLWKRGAIGSVLLPPAAAGAAAFALAGRPEPPIADFLTPGQALGLFALPIDYVAAGGAGALLGKRAAGAASSVWWLFEMLIWSHLRDALTHPLPGEPREPPRPRPLPPILPPPTRPPVRPAGKRRR